MTLVDVTNPLKPKKLVEGFGDFTNNGKSQRHANQVHSAFGWVNDETGRAYVIMTDDEEATDTDIIEITNPSRPKWVADYDLTPAVGAAAGAVHGDAVFIHDEIVKKINGRYIALLSYWDGGYIKLDVTDPANADVHRRHRLRRSSTRCACSFGQQVSPEGNGHQAEFTRDNQLFIATDEDFDPYRVVATINDGPFAGTEFTADPGLATCRRSTPTRRSSATPAASASPATRRRSRRPMPTHTIAVIERGVCDFTVKVQNVEAAGYDGAIVFNRTGVDGCETLITMLAEADIPALFVSRTDGFRILGASLDGYTCSEDGHRHRGARGRHRRLERQHQRGLRRLGLRPPVRRRRRWPTSTSTSSPSPRTRRSPRASATCRSTRSRPIRTRTWPTSRTTPAASGC